MSASGMRVMFGFFALVLSLIHCACGHDRPPDGWDQDGGRDGDDFQPGDPLEIIHLDVGEGDATLVVGPGGFTILVDGGPAGSGFAILAELDRRGSDRLDAILATHPDEDHIGGLAEVIQAGVDVAAAFSEGNTSQSLAYRNLVAALAGTDAGGLETLQPGAVFDLGESAWARCTASGGRLYTGTRVLVSDLNDRSLALHVRYGGFDYHVGGDLGGGGLGRADVETPLGAAIGDMDVVHLHHHGSATSTNAAWLNSTLPEVVVLSLGPNPYGHPDPGVVARITGQDPRVTAPAPEVVQTGQGEHEAGKVLGTFSVVTDGATFTLDGRTREVDE